MRLLAYDLELLVFVIVFGFEIVCGFGIWVVVGCPLLDFAGFGFCSCVY